MELALLIFVILAIVVLLPVSKKARSIEDEETAATREVPADNNNGNLDSPQPKKEPRHKDLGDAEQQVQVPISPRISAEESKEIARKSLANHLCTSDWSWWAYEVRLHNSGNILFYRVKVRFERAAWWGWSAETKEGVADVDAMTGITIGLHGAKATP